jgi:hypothetical protein
MSGASVKTNVHLVLVKGDWWLNLGEWVGKMRGMGCYDEGWVAKLRGIGVAKLRGMGG